MAWVARLGSGLLKHWRGEYLAWLAAYELLGVAAADPARHCPQTRQLKCTQPAARPKGLQANQKHRESKQPTCWSSIRMPANPAAA